MTVLSYVGDFTGLPAVGCYLHLPETAHHPDIVHNTHGTLPDNRIRSLKGVRRHGETQWENSAGPLEVLRS